MGTITIKKPKTLEQQILNLEICQEAYISNRDYRPMSVRKLVWMMNQKHTPKEFRATDKDIIDGIYVIRIK